MPASDPPPITLMLNGMTAPDSDPAAADRLLGLVYDQLHQIARGRMSAERSGHTLQATALVHEAYLRLLGEAPDVPWRDRSHFYRAAAESMRRILVDHARRRAAEKRGGRMRRLAIDICDLAAADDPQQIIALDDAMTKLQQSDPDAAEVLRLRFFAGLTVEQTAAALGISERTVKREWSYARARVMRLIEGP